MKYSSILNEIPSPNKCPLAHVVENRTFGLNPSPDSYVPCGREMLSTSVSNKKKMFESITL